MRLIQRIIDLFRPTMSEQPKQESLQPESKIKVIKLAEGSIRLENPGLLSVFPQEVQDQFDQLSWLDAAEALGQLAESRATQGDFETAEKIVDQIKDQTAPAKDKDRLYWGRARGILSLAIAEFKQGQQEKAEKRIYDLITVIGQQQPYDQEHHFVSVSKYYLETRQTDKLRELTDKVKRDPNSAWRIVEPWADLELEQGNYEAALSLEDLLGYDTYKIDLRVQIAKKIGHQLPDKATEILEGAEELAAKDKLRSPDHRVDQAWAFIGQPEKIKGKPDPFQTVELAKHFFTVGNKAKAESLLKEASEKANSERFWSETIPAEILIQIAKAYLLENNRNNAKKYLYQAIQKVAGINYRGQYQEEMSYEKDGTYQRIEDVLAEIKDIDGLKKVLEVVGETSEYRVQLEIFSLLLSKAD